ncbi:MAG TPA: hypothetical protein VI818_05610 [Candidatus Thermoplasmatota archaeon]|nr:hypothetical protein [Candidatus Thermoplasmatota archaeon]
MPTTRAPTLVLVLALLFGLFAVALPGAAAQTEKPKDNTVVVEDAEKDVDLFIANRAGGPKQSGSSMGTYFDHLDVKKLVFGYETEKDFKVELHMKSLVQDPNLGTASRQISWSYGAVRWTLQPGECRGQNGGMIGQPAPSPSMGCLRGQGVQFVKNVPMQTVSDQKAFVFTIDKSFVFNHNRVTARFGDSLLNITVSATQTYVRCFACFMGDPTGGVYASDRAPQDPAQFGAPFTFQLGGNGRGFLGLTSAEPIRVSNGEATTIVYKADLTSQAKEPITVQLETANTEEGWSVRVPSLLKVEAGQTVTFPVILALPFTHDHGRTATFLVKAQAVEDEGSYAELSLGVFWTDVPQPSAHHEGEGGGTFFHSAPDTDANGFEQVLAAFPRFNVWMNALDQDPDPDARDDPVPSLFNEGLFCVFPQGGGQGCKTPPESKHTWFFPLQPSLLLGLDFELSREGLFVFDILPKLQATSAKVVVELLYCDPAQMRQGGQGGGGGGGGGGGAGCSNNTWNYGKVLARGERAGALAAGTAAHYEVPLKMDPGAEILQYKKGANIGLRIVFTADTPQNIIGNGPEFITNKAHMDLPLIEYHDPVDQAFQNVGTLALVSKTPFEKRVNPGRTAVYKFDVKSNATDDQDVVLEVQGVNQDWARIVGDEKIELTPGESREIMLAISVPADAVAEERAELFFVAQNLRDSAVVAVTRLRATVVDPAVEVIPDEAGQITDLDSDGGSPGFEALAILVGLAVVVAARRRR